MAIPYLVRISLITAVLVGIATGLVIALTCFGAKAEPTRNPYFVRSIAGGYEYQRVPFVLNEVEPKWIAQRFRVIPAIYYVKKKPRHRRGFSHT